MLDVSNVNETSPEANWNRQTGRQADRQANLCVGRLRLQKQDQLFIGSKLDLLNKSEINISKFNSTQLDLVKHYCVMLIIFCIIPQYVHNGRRCYIRHKDSLGKIQTGQLLVGALA